MSLGRKTEPGQFKGLQWISLLTFGCLISLSGLGAFILRKWIPAVADVGLRYDNPSSISPRLLHTTRTDVDFKGSSWCPNAVCRNGPLCRPCQRRFLVLLATGRSASTTLTYMLDALPGVRMSGENNNTLMTIRTMIDGIRYNIDFTRPTVLRNEPGPWGHNPVPAGAWSCVRQHMIETINPPLIDKNGTGVLIEDDVETIVGFKTIRLLRGVKEEEYESLINWLQDIFPCTRYMINIRSSVKEQVKSWQKTKFLKSWQRDKFLGDLNFTGYINELNAQMRKFADLLGKEQAFLLDASEFTKDINQINQLVEWLGFDESCHFDKLLEFNIEGKGGFKHGRTNVTIDPSCRYVG